MFVETPSLLLPANLETPIWRYIDLAKLASMLDTSGLFFASPATLAKTDPWEMAFPSSFVNVIFKRAIAEHEKAEREWAEQEEAWPPKRGVPYPPHVSRGYLHLGIQRESFLRSIFVNCWHLNEYESAAMWKVYSAGSYTVAIQSTVQRLIDSFAKTENPIRIGLVKYIDYEKEPQPWDDNLTPCFFKRRSFEHERELRAAYIQGGPGPPPDPPGILIESDLSRLIQAVRVSPFDPDWFFDVVKSLVKKFGFANTPVERSDLLTKPASISD